MRLAPVATTSRHRAVQAAALSLVALTGVAFLAPLADRVTEAVSYVGTFATGAIMLGALGWAARVNTGSGRVPWLVTLGVYLSGFVLYALDPHVPGSADGEFSAATFVGPFATVAQIGVVGAVGRAVLAEHRLRRVLLEAAWLGGAALLLVWEVVGAPVVGSTRLAMVDKVALIGQLSSFAVLAGFVVALLASTDPGARRLMILLCSPALLLATALTVQARVIASGTLAPGSVPDFLFPLAFGVGGAAVLESRRIAEVRPVASSPGGVIGPLTWAPLGVWIGMMVLQELGLVPRANLGVVVGIIAVVRLSTLLDENQNLARDLAARASHDHLTGLPNRSALERALARDGVESSVLLLVDLDRFKTVNDTLGHRAGDQLLMDAAHRMQDVAPDAWMVARLAGDEFVLFGPAACGGDPEVLAHDLVAALSRRFEVDGREVWVGATVGIATTAAGFAAGELLDAADTALRSAKGSRRGEVVRVGLEIRREADRRNELESALRAGIEAGELRCRYQPKVDLASRELVGVEALVRWDRPGHGMVAPDDFIGVAEESGLVTRIDEWVLDAAVAQLGKWNEMRPARRLDLATNMSAWQLSRTDVHETVARTIAANGRVDPGQVTVELTETALVESPDVVARRLARLRDVGVHVAIDDFGVGFTALAYLRRFPVTTVKIDRTLVAELDGGPRDVHSFAAAVIAMGTAMGLQVVAEGVETTAQVESLLRMGCRVAQGFLFSPPVEAAEIDRMIGERVRLGADAARS